MSLLGIDVGTTGCKAIVFRGDGVILGLGYREYRLAHPRPGWAELDSDQVWAATKESIREAVRGAGRRDPVTALSVSSQGEAATPYDAQGHALSPSIVSFDSRTAAQQDRWAAGPGAEAVFGITGMPLHTMYTLLKIQWVKENQPEVYDRTWKFLCYGDGTLFRLGGMAAIDLSLAARTMALDVRAGRWSEEMLATAGVERGKLSEVVHAGTVVGEVSSDVAHELGLPAGVKLIAGGHDQACGALGSGIARAGVALDATGTVECIAPAFDRLVLTPEMLRNNYCCYAHVVPGLFITLAFNFTGGCLLRWYRDNFGDKEAEEARVSGLNVYDILLGKAGTSPSPLLVLPHFTVTGTPWFDARARGAILGLTLATNKGDLIKGILDGITYEMRLNLECLQQCGVSIQELRAIGGGAQSRTWMQLKADIFERPVTALNVSEAACLGAAMLAGVATGVFSSFDEATTTLVQEAERFEPNSNAAESYRARYAIYKDVYPALRDLSHRLSALDSA